jgi:hypothetical protein
MWLVASSGGKILAGAKATIMTVQKIAVNAEMGELRVVMYIKSP